MTLVEDLLKEIADVTLIDEDTKSILTDDANKEIPSKMTIHVVPPGGQIFHNATDAPWWLNFQQMHVEPPVE